VRNFNYKEQEEQEYHRPDPPPDRSQRGPWPFPHRVHGVERGQKDRCRCSASLRRSLSGARDTLR
jgi:hypothetical protein